MLDLTKSENIYFDFWIKAEYFLNPPFIKILIDDEIYFEDSIKKNIHLRFKKKCSFADSHKIKILRFGKTTRDTKVSSDGTMQSQTLIIEKIKIDNIDLRNLIQHRCLYRPVYPEPWASQQAHLDVDLPKTLKGTTILGHNGEWEFEFKSPVYKFLIDWIKNKL